MGDDETNLDTLSNISKKTFKSVRIYDSIDPAKARSFFVIQIDGEEKFIHKSQSTYATTEFAQSEIPKFRTRSQVVLIFLLLKMKILGSSQRFLRRSGYFSIVF